MMEKKQKAPKEKRRYLGSGCYFTDLHYSYRMGISTIANIVREVCNIIWLKLTDEFLPKLNSELLQNVAEGFEERANFPHCIGAVDGKHIRMIKPIGSGSMFFNYKSYFSVVLMAVADSNYRFIYVDVGAYGSECDSTVFKESSLWKNIQTQKLQLPNPRPLYGSLNPDIPYFFIGDEGFALSTHLLRPFAGKDLNYKKKIFNYRLCRARRYVECTFGILANKWRIFHRPLNVHTDLAVNIVKACVVLHNFVREKDGYNFEDTVSTDGFHDIPTHQISHGQKAGTGIRNVLADYFVTDEGSVSWQNSKI